MLDTAVPPLLKKLQQLPPATEGDAVGTLGSGRSSLGSSQGVVAEKKHACASLVELSEIPGVFATALSALLTGENYSCASETVTRAVLHSVSRKCSFLRKRFIFTHGKSVVA